MSKLLTGKDIEALIAQGQCPAAAAEGAVLTPSARDALRDWKRQRKETAKNAPTPAAAPDRNQEFTWAPGSDPKAIDLEAFYHSAPIAQLRQLICETGQRLWQRGYVDGDGGNMTVRVGDNLALCTPDRLSKGFLTPADIVLTDLDGKRKAGNREPSCESLAHFAILATQPAAKAIVHAHPPHATAFALANIEPPTCLIPEAELFLGKIALAPYETPGSTAEARALSPVAKDHQAILIRNHGALTWGKSIADAAYKMENLEAYLQTLTVAAKLGRPLGEGYGSQKMQEIIALRKQMGMEDIRDQWKECELCDNSEFQPGYNEAGAGGEACACNLKTEQPNIQRNQEAEAVIQQVTDLIMAELDKA